MTKDELTARFVAQFGESEEPVRCYFAPGRVNIIGEHQDYNGGHVFPAALTVGIWGAMRVRSDKKVRLFSENMDTTVEVDVSMPLRYDATRDWANYPLGIIDYLQRGGHDMPGMDLYFVGNLPAGAGLSSSACILDLTGYMLWDYLGVPLDMTKLAEMAQQVEYNFVGVKVGIMDQFAISQGKAGHGVLLDCTTMNYELVPLNWGDYRLIIMNTNKKRGLVDSKFNERKGECDAALAEIQKHYPLTALSLAKESDLDYIADEVLRRRARHALTENLRVLRFMDALRAGDTNEIAEILTASHTSLQQDYEVSGKELDTMVTIARQQPGCLASRMTGAGFGGCAIALVETAQVEAFKEAVTTAYTKAIGTKPSMYEAEIGDGVHALS
ncbi:galactokinase [Veillonella magna]|uniref:galactokinase n=1 Tax=Veillonella magna TaxID=464322 RepID=UPI0023EF6171|nr:galactokinase [Veillonella magna]MBD8976178.1 galactokinase [Veillonella magna]